MGLCTLSREGEFAFVGDIRVLYTSMMFIRNYFVSMAGQNCIAAVKVGLRYAIVRRQFKTIEGQKIERPIIDYQTLLSVYGSLLARSFAIQITGMYLNEQF